MLTSLRTGFFLALKSIRHSSLWTSVLIVFVMLVTFLNLVVVSGFMMGLFKGAEDGIREGYMGDVIVSPLDNKTYILKPQEIQNILNGVPDVQGYTARYLTTGSVEANYKTRSSDQIANKRSATINGVNPEDEDRVTKLSEGMIEGEWLDSSDVGNYIVIGKDALAKYSYVADADPTLLREVGVGSKVRLEVTPEGSIQLMQPTQVVSVKSPDTFANAYEYTVKGIVRIKAEGLSSGIYMVDSDVRKITGKHLDEVSQISIKVTATGSPDKIKSILVQNGFDSYAKVQTFDEAMPEVVLQMKDLFNTLGIFFGGIGVIVAATTLFIVIFINALTRRRQIGILKGVGIRARTIIWSYVFQSLFYSIIGSLLGLFITYGILVPYFTANPIDLTVYDGYIVAEYGSTMMRAGVLVVVAMFAGLIPSWMVVRRNTLDAILGR